MVAAGETAGGRERPAQYGGRIRSNGVAGEVQAGAEDVKLMADNGTVTSRVGSPSPNEGSIPSPRQGNNFLSGSATPQTLNLDVAGTRTPEKLLSDKAAKTYRRDVRRATDGSRERPALHMMGVGCTAGHCR